MLKKDNFINDIWDKYDSYNNSRNKDKFFTQHVYKNTQYALNLKTFSTFLLLVIITVGMTYAAIVTYDFIQKSTNADLKKNADYDYTQDMTYQDGVYYRKITNYDDYIVCKNRWNNIVEMSKEDFNENFMVIIASENYSTIGLTITDIHADDNTTYIELKKSEEDSKDTIISTKIINELYRDKISVQIIPEVPNVHEYAKLEDLPKSYKKEDAIKDNCFVVENNKIISDNVNQLDEFIENSEKNISTSIRIVIYFDDKINIVDLEYKNNKFIMSDDATRKESGTIYYYTGNKITKIKSSPSGMIYMLENDETYNKFPICAINF